MWKEEFEPRGPKGSNDQGQNDPNFGRLFAVGLAVALALFFGSLVPGPFVAPVISELLLFSALGAVFVALLRGDPVDANEITGWDQAAILLLFSLLCGFFVDPGAVSEALSELAGETARMPK